MMKDKVQNEADLKQVLNKYNLFIKNLYISIASGNSNFEIDLKLFSRFVMGSNLMDQEFNTATVSKVFIASNVSDTNPDKIVDNILINRPEFLGCIVRLALFKYHETGKCKSLAEATEKILTEDILTRQGCAEGIFFRAQNLYSNPEVESLLKANEDLIKSHVFVGINNRASCSAMVKKAKLIMRETQVDLFFYECLESQIQFKDTLYEMSLPEFLIFLCRLAGEAYVKEQIPFHKKLHKCIDTVLKSVGQKIKN